MEKSEVQVDSHEISSSPVSPHSESVPTAQAWPTQPKPLVPSKRENFWLAVYDSCLIALPIALIVKTGLVILAHKLDETHTGSSFDQATALSRYLVAFNSQLVTLFTIIFVTIISTCVKRYALYKAQEGAFLSELEQLQGSISLPSTLKLILSLRSYSVLSFVLVAIWSFYYLGSQAAKQEYEVSLSDPYTKQYAMLQRSDGSSLFDLSQAEIIQNNITGYNIRDMNYRFANALLTAGMPDATKSDDPTLGTNGGPLIPDLGLVLTTANTESTLDKLVQQVFGWVDVSKSSTKQDALYQQNLFTSFQGVEPNVVYWTPKAPDAQSYYTQMLGSYLVPTSYLSLTCSDLELLPLDSFPNGTSYNTSVSLNITAYRADAPKDVAGNALRELTYNYRTLVNYNYTIYHDPDLVMAGGVEEYHTLQSTCNITRKNVDLKVVCTTMGCYPHSMRWQNNTNELQATSYSTPFDSLEFGNRFLSNLTLSTGTSDDWLNDYTLLESNFLTPSWSPAWNPTSEFPLGSGPSRAMTQVVNTYLTLSQSAFASLNIVPWDINAVMTAGSNPVYQKIVVDGAQFMRSYRIDWRWIPIDFVSSIILLCAAIASWWLRMKTLAPDIFGYVSSLTRDNEHIPLPTEGSMLNGIDRARMLKHVKVKIGDIEASSSGERPVGRVGLAPADASISGLQRERLYV